VGERYDYVSFGPASGIYFVRDNGISIARTDNEADAQRIAAALNQQAADANTKQQAESYEIACEILEDWQESRVAAGLDPGCCGSVCDGISRLCEMVEEAEAAALSAQEEPAPPTMTPEEARQSQNWRGISGAIAYHLIDRHADNWADISVMMDAWLEANALNAQGMVQEALPERWSNDRRGGDCTDEQNGYADGYEEGWNNCLDATRAALAAVKGVDRD
jgi:hypothetical protein